MIKVESLTTHSTHGHYRQNPSLPNAASCGVQSGIASAEWTKKINRQQDHHHDQLNSNNEDELSSVTTKISDNVVVTLSSELSNHSIPQSSKVTDVGQLLSGVKTLQLPQHVASKDESNHVPESHPDYVERQTSLLQLNEKDRQPGATLQQWHGALYNRSSEENRTWNAKNVDSGIAGMVIGNSNGSDDSSSITSISNSGGSGSSNEKNSREDHLENEEQMIPIFSASPRDVEYQQAQREVKWIRESDICPIGMPSDSDSDGNRVSKKMKLCKAGSKTNSFNVKFNKVTSNGPPTMSTNEALEYRLAMIKEIRQRHLPSSSKEIVKLLSAMGSPIPQHLNLASASQTQLLQKKRSLPKDLNDDINYFTNWKKGVVALSPEKMSNGSDIKAHHGIKRSSSVLQPRIIAKLHGHSKFDTSARCLQFEIEKGDQSEFSILNIIPSLISEKHRKAAFVENLVDTAALIVEVIWQHFHINPAAKIIPIRTFLQETLRRSRTSYSTLQTALFYIFRIKSQITQRAFVLPSANRNSSCPLTPASEDPPQRNGNNDPATCGRRMFLAALIVASKYLQDRNYSNKAWSKISGLPVNEINQNEIIFLKLIDYNLFIAEDIFKRWSSLLLTHIQAISGSTMDNANAFRQAENQRAVESFRETLRNMDPQTMEFRKHNHFTSIFPITPDVSAPSSPSREQEESSLHSSQ